MEGLGGVLSDVGSTSGAEDRSVLTRRIDALLADAEAGGAFALQAAKQAAVLADPIDPQRFRRALTLAAKLDPLNASPRLALARRLAEEGDLDAARREAAQVMAEAVDEAARAHASFVLGEIARAKGDGQEARVRFAAAAVIEDKLLAADPHDRSAAHWYARAVGRVAELDLADGQHAKARTGAEGALAVLRALASQNEEPLLAADVADAEMRLAALDLEQGKPAAARAHLGEAIGRYEALVLMEPDEPHWRAVLADCWVLAAEAAFERGAPGEARAAMDKALQLRVKLATLDEGERWALAATWRTRASLLSAIGEITAATESLHQGRALAETMFAQTQTEAAARFLVHTLIDQADMAMRLGDLERAREAANEARKRAEPYARGDDAAEWRADLAAAWDRLGDTARAAGVAPKALEAYARAIDLRRMVHKTRPDAAYPRRGLAGTLLKVGDIALAARDLRGARAAFDESLALRLALAEANPGLPGPARDLAVALERVGLAAVAAGDEAGARRAWEDELVLAERLYSNEYDFEGQRFRAVVEANLAGLGGERAEIYRTNALRRFDTLEREGRLTERDAKARANLWRR